MFFFKLYKIRSYEAGLLFRDGEFAGLLEAGTHWFFDPLGEVRVDVVSPRDPWLQHEKLDLIVRSGGYIYALERNSTGTGLTRTYLGALSGYNLLG